MSIRIERGQLASFSNNVSQRMLEEKQEICDDKIDKMALAVIVDLQTVHIRTVKAKKKGFRTFSWSVRLI